MYSLYVEIIGDEIDAEHRGWSQYNSTQPAAQEIQDQNIEELSTYDAAMGLDLII